MIGGDGEAVCHRSEDFGKAVLGFGEECFHLGRNNRHQARASDIDDAGDLVGVRVGLEGLTRAVDRCREWIGDALNSALESTGAGHRVPNGNAVMETSE